MVQHLTPVPTRRFQQRPGAQFRSVILSEAKNLSGHFGVKKERFFVAREKQRAPILRAALLRMTRFTRMYEEERVA